MRGADARVECVLPWSASLAEGPFWSVAEQRLYWVDILEPAVHRFDPASGHNETCPLPRLVSSVIGRQSGGLIVTTSEGVEELDFTARQLVKRVNPEAMQPENRFQRCEMRPRRAPLGGYDEP